MALKVKNEESRMKNELNEQQVFQKLAALCARAEHCQWEMLEKMRQWGIDDEVQARIMARLVGERYVDDRRYAEAFVRDKVRYNQWGRRKVEQALWMKHIDGDIAREALDAIDTVEYTDTLRPLLAQKRRTVKARNDYERNMKLMKWALGRGFTMDVIRQCLSVEEDF